MYFCLVLNYWRVGLWQSTNFDSESQGHIARNWCQHALSFEKEELKIPVGIAESESDPHTASTWECLVHVVC